MTGSDSSGFPTTVSTSLPLTASFSAEEITPKEMMHRSDFSIARKQCLLGRAKANRDNIRVGIMIAKCSVDSDGIPHMLRIQNLLLIAEFEEDWHRAEGCRWLAEQNYLYAANDEDWYRDPEEIRSVVLKRLAVKQKQETCAPPTVNKRAWFREEYFAALPPKLEGGVMPLQGPQMEYIQRPRVRQAQSPQQLLPPTLEAGGMNLVQRLQMMAEAERHQMMEARPQQLLPPTLGADGVVRVQGPQMMQVQSPGIMQVQQPPMMQVQQPPMMQVQNPPTMQVQNPPTVQVQSFPTMQVQQPPMMQAQRPSMMQVQRPPMMQVQRPQQPQPPSKADAEMRIQAQLERCQSWGCLV